MSCATLALHQYSTSLVILVLEIIIWSIVVYGSTKAIPTVKKTFYKAVVDSVFIFYGLFISAYLLFLGFIVYDEGNNPISYSYFNVNAAIKNTCILDPQQNHCPHHVNDIIAIEPQTFEQQLKGKHLTYSYYPQTNDYTLIIRHNDNQTAIFDSRIPKVASGSSDIVDTVAQGCGPISVEAPHNLPGPWNNIN